MNEELKKLLNGVNSTWELMKKELDKTKANGEQTAEQKEKVEKMENELDKLEKQMQDIQAKMNRPDPAAAALEKKELETKDSVLRKEAFFKQMAGIKLTEAEQKTMTLADEESLGFLAPPEFVAEIIKNVVQFSPIRQFANVRAIKGREITRPRRKTTLAASWIGETGLPDETTKKHELLKIPAHKLGALAKVSQDSLEDISFLEQDLRDEFIEQFQVSEGAGFLSGNGVEKPHGVLSNTDIGIITSATTGVITFDDLIDLQTELKEPYWPNSRFYFQRLTMRVLRKIKDSNGQYIWEPATAAGTPAMILGFPYALLPDMDQVAAGNKPIMFGDMRKTYMIVDRTEMEVQVFREKYAPEIGYLATRRVGGQVTLPEAMKVLKVKA